jgi:hypothetical protein
MSATPPVTASPSASKWGRLIAWRSVWHRLTPLGRDVVLILIVKAIVLCLIWFAFFRGPAAPQMAMEPRRVESRLLSPSAVPEVPDALH